MAFETELARLAKDLEHILQCEALSPENGKYLARREAELKARIAQLQTWQGEVATDKAIEYLRIRRK